MPKSDDLGRAFEFICVQCLKDEISQIRQVKIIENSNYIQDENNWARLDNHMKQIMEKEAKAAIPTLYDLEPMILENDGDILTLKIQSDRQGMIGDVRDILLIRESERWTIGISIKHNHFAVKHSRLASGLDFGDSWFGIPCSDAYWNAIKPIFNPLIELRGRMLWSSFPNKETTVYIPLLNAFMDEVKRNYQKDSSVPARMVEYLLGKYDFYKLIGLDNKNITSIICFNLRGSLNKPSKKNSPNKSIPTSLLPTRIISFEFKPNSTNTVELYMNNGWQFSFRIHNASKLIEPSLKFDIQIIGMPTTIITINCPWK